MGKKQKREPHFLLIGAGVTGSYYAARLQRAGVHITILCRPERQSYLQENGIVLTEYYTGTRSHLAVRTVLEPQDEYDYVLIFLPTHRTGDLLPQLEKLSTAKAFIFFGNNVQGFEEVQQRLGDDRVLAGIPALVGVREQQVVRYADAPKATKKPCDTLWIGEIEEPNNRAIRHLKHAFGRANIKVQRSIQIRERLLTRATLMLPIALGLYASGHKPETLAYNRERQRLIVKAWKECALMLRSRGGRITPLKYRLLLLLPEGLLAAKLKRFLESPFAAIAFAAHTGEARREVRELYDGLKKHAKQSDTLLPSLKELYQSATKRR